MNKILVTGSNGFLGSFLVEELLRRNFEVKCLVRKTSNLRWIKDLPVKFIYGEITKPETLEDAVKDTSYIFHVAAIKRALNKKKYYEVNQEGTANLLDAAAEHCKDLKRFIYISSLAVAGPCSKDSCVLEGSECSPITLYGKSKLAGEKEVLKFKDKIPFTIIRLPVLYGPREDDMYLFFKTVKAGIVVLPGIKDRKMSLCYINDAVKGIMLSAFSDKAVNQVYYISDEMSCTHKEMALEIARKMNKKVFVLRIPSFCGFGVAFIADMIGKIIRKAPVLSIEKMREATQEAWICSIEKAKKDLGFSHEYPLERGVEKTVNWYKQNNWL